MAAHSTSEPALSTAWAQSQKQDAQRPSLLDLPRELRDLIYGFAFHVPGAILFYPKNPYEPERLLRAKIVRHKNAGAVEPKSVCTHISMGLLQTCRQLHAECTPVLYGDNFFHIMFLDINDIALAYRQLIRYVIVTTEVAYHIIDGDLDAVSHGWKRRLWPNILYSGKKALAQFPIVESVTVTMKPGVESTAWRPVFFVVGGKTAERRIELAAEWMLERCPLEDERLRDCLHLELLPPPGSMTKEEYAGSRFAPDEEDWDYTEFENAFELMKVLDLPTSPT